MLGLCFVVKFFVSNSAIIWLRKRELVDLLCHLAAILLSVFCVSRCSAMSWSTVCDCDISWSYSFAFLSISKNLES